MYIHLNNDRTLRNDNRGGCTNGIAYAPGLQVEPAGPGRPADRVRRRLGRRERHRLPPPLRAAPERRARGLALPPATRGVQAPLRAAAGRRDDAEHARRGHGRLHGRPTPTRSGSGSGSRACASRTAGSPVRTGTSPSLCRRTRPTAGGRSRVSSRRRA